jgi:hypothetical protein
MDVHHHSNTSRKKWTHYFWEFLMLFLAVFCGFLAEYQLEHTIEKQREREYVITLAEDLGADTTALNEVGWFIKKCLARYDSVSPKLKPPILKENLETYYKECFEIYNFHTFKYNDRTIEQLRSSGNFRLVRNKKVTNQLVFYDRAVRSAFSLNSKVLWDQRLKLLSLQDDIIDKDLLKYYDLDNGVFIPSGVAGPNALPFTLLTKDNRILSRYYNEWKDNEEFLEDFLIWVNTLCKKAKDLLLLIKEEYRLS